MPSQITGLYAITNEQLMLGDLLLSKVRAAFMGGCKLLQYRNKTASFVQQLDEALQLQALCHEYQAILIINDNIDLAIACRADGVHLGQTDTPLAHARERLGNELILGSTCHDSLALAETAQEAGADYLAFGRFFPSQTKPNAPPADLALLDEAQQIIKLPVVAIGGITSDNAGQLIRAGADCIAVSYELFKGGDLNAIENRAQNFQSLFMQ